MEPSAFAAVQMFTHAVWRFFNFYIVRGGFLDGGRGLYAAMTASFYVFLKYAKAYERRLKVTRDPSRAPESLRTPSARAPTCAPAIAAAPHNCAWRF